MFRWIFVLGLAAVLVAGLGWSGSRLRDANLQQSYITAPVQRGDLLVKLAATGSLAARVSVAVGSQLSGQISELLVDFNDNVAKGQVLARLDPRSFEARVREAEAALRVAEARVALVQAALERAETQVIGSDRQLAEAEAVTDRVRLTAQNEERAYQRTQRLRATLPLAAVEDAQAATLAASADLRAAQARHGVVQQGVLAAKAEVRSAQAEIRNAEATVAQQRAVLDQARIDLDRTFIRAPIDGLIVGHDADVGQTVAASLESPTLFSIVEDLRKMHIFVAVDEADISRVRVGQQAWFVVDAYPGRQFQAEVIEMRKAPRQIEGVVAYTVVLAVDNPDQLLLPGMTAVVQLVTERIVNAIQVPTAALRFRPEVEGLLGSRGEAVWVPGAGGRPVAIAVTTGLSDGMATEIVTGALEPGRPVIVGETGIHDPASPLHRLLGR